MRPRPKDCPAALAWISEGPYDVRPHLVALFYAGNLLSLPPVLTYGLGYLSTWACARGVARSEAAMKAAAADGLMRLYLPSKVEPADDRARQLRMRATSYRTLCNAAHGTYRLRLMEGAERFVRVAYGSENTPRVLSDNSGFKAGEWWCPMQAKRDGQKHSSR